MSLHTHTSIAYAIIITDEGRQRKVSETSN